MKNGKIINNMDDKKKKMVIIGIIAIIIVVLLFSSIKIINTGSIGVRIRFGKVLNKTMNDGVNFKIPFIETVKVINTKIQKATVSGSAASRDLQDVRAEVAINFRVDRNQAVELYKEVGTSYISTILEPAINETLKATISLYTAEELITKRQEVSNKAQELLQEKFIGRGIIIEDFNMLDLSFSEEFNRAIEEKQVAEQQVLKAKQELEKAKVDAEKKITEAASEAEALRLQKQEITDNLLRLREIEAQLAAIKKWDGKLPNYTGGTIPFISID